MSLGRVLIVDDYEPNLAGMRELLQAAGYVVRTEINGEDALRAAIDDPPDLILLDVMMPGISGLEVCRQLKQHPTSRLTPVVLVSGSADRENRLTGISHGADDFLNKPLDSDELLLRARSLVRVKRLTDALESAEALVETLGRVVEARDPNTEGHCERLARYSAALGQRVGVDDADLEALHRGAFLHDVGKIGIPDRILLKPGRLTPDEMRVMRDHPIIGDTLCGTVRSLERVRPIIRHHHERRDGGGYPDRLGGDDIPLLAQIVSVVDVFDAVTTDRPYRHALSSNSAYNLLRQEADKGWCRRELVEIFIELHQERSVDAWRERPVRVAATRIAL